MPITWYVTFHVRKRGLLHGRERSPRETRTFLTEGEAKKFAGERLQEGLVVFAGTINPHCPKRLVNSADIPNWLAEPDEPAGSDGQQFRQK